MPQFGYILSMIAYVNKYVFRLRFKKTNCSDISGCSKLHPVFPSVVVYICRISTELLMLKLTKQGYVAPKLTSSLQNIYRRYHNLVDRDEISTVK